MMPADLQPATPEEFSTAVLVVDDEPAIVEMLAIHLGARGLPVASAHSGEVAMEKIESGAFGCVLSDRKLPGVDGIEVLRFAKTIQPYCAGIMMTAHVSPESAVEALRLGAADYVEKPFPNVRLVAEKVNRAINHHRTRFERDWVLARLGVVGNEATAEGGEDTLGGRWDGAAIERLATRLREVDEQAEVLRQLRGAVGDRAAAIRGALTDIRADVADPSTERLVQILADLDELVRYVED